MSSLTGLCLNPICLSTNILSLTGQSARGGLNIGRTKNQPPIIISPPMADVIYQALQRYMLYYTGQQRYKIIVVRIKKYLPGGLLIIFNYFSANIYQ